MRDFLLALVAGTATGILSAFGVGGGSLLLVYMTSVIGLEQQLAQGINLLYFLPAALMALPSHIKNGYIEKETVSPAVWAGLTAALLGSWIATGVDTSLLRRCFGGYLLIIGMWELFHRSEK